MVRKILRLLSSRYGIAAILLLVVIVVVGIARATGGTGPDPTVDGGESTTNQDAGEPDDGVASGDEAPTSDEDPLPEEAVTAATKFVEAYIDTDRPAAEWRAEVGKYSTSKVKEELKIIDPDVVPVQEISDEPNVTEQTVEFPTNADLLILFMKAQDGKWLVNGIDNEKS